MKEKLVKGFIITTFVSLYFLVSIISTIHVIDFFELSNNRWMSITLAVGFELGAAASLASLIALDKMNKWIVWLLFFLITAMQIQGNMYFAFTRLSDFQGWVELFNLLEWDVLAQKRLLAGISGAILPIVALGFIKALVDYVKPQSEEAEKPRIEDAVDYDRQIEQIMQQNEEESIEGENEAQPEIEATVEEGYVEEKSEPIEEIRTKPVKEFEASADKIENAESLEVDVINIENEEVETVKVKSNNVNRPKPNMNLLEKLNSGLIEPQSEKRIIK